MLSKTFLRSLACLTAFVSACSDDSNGDFFDSPQSGSVLDTLTLTSSDEAFTKYCSAQYPLCVEDSKSGDSGGWSSMTTSVQTDVVCDAATYETSCGEDNLFVSYCQYGFVQQLYQECIGYRDNGQGFELTREGECRSFSVNDQLFFDCFGYGIAELCDQEGEERQSGGRTEQCARTDHDELIWVEIDLPFGGPIPLHPSNN